MNTTHDGAIDDAIELSPTVAPAFPDRHRVAVPPGGDEPNTFDVWAMTRVGDGWSFRVEGGDDRSVVDLPERDGTASWPAIGCGG